MQPIEMARAMCEDVYGKGKTDLLKQMLADDFVSNDPIRGKLDRAGIESNVQLYRRAFPDLTLEVIDSIASGDKAVVRWRATGTHKGELFGVQATNRRITIEGMSEIRTSKGKIQENWDQWNALGMMRELGAIPDSMMRAASPNGGGARAAAPSEPRR